MTRYEALRAIILGQEPPQGALGLHVLQNEGMREWLRVAQSSPIASRETSLEGLRPSIPHPSEFIPVLANFVINIVRGEKHDN